MFQPASFPTLTKKVLTSTTYVTYKVDVVQQLEMMRLRKKVGVPNQIIKTGYQGGGIFRSIRGFPPDRTFLNLRASKSVEINVRVLRSCSTILMPKILRSGGQYTC